MLMPEAEPTTDTPAPEVLELRSRIAELEAQNGELPRYARENALLKAGIDVTKGLGKLALTAYDGELETDAIQAWMTEITGEEAPALPETTDTAQADRATAGREISNLAAGAVVPGQEPDPDPWDEGYAAFHDKDPRQAQRPRATKQAEVIHRIMDAGYNRNDPRVVFDQNEWAEQQRLAGHRSR